MGLEFGHLTRLVGITYYTISPHEQRVLKGTLNPGIRNTVRRTRDKMFLWGIPFLVLITVVATANEYHYKINRKNPADYAHEV